ncbi:hypothetical protein J0895_17875 [Phormidium pseudopriestleyi FRX01]|uniref:Uncharacterized protein n=1 Tax=Phormidium pseudopriestleyi FRX01 TaxID=1759528 RepID=A0ABS3FUW5_9CYAN|nr:hypothetical protein [Phormidium pseudopriestleyi]MBO0350900.1 hypothetical protein [Phormidium pseudopriestleyi FRX01]
MTLNPKLLNRAIPYWIGGLICFEVAIVIIYLGGVFIHRKVYHPFDMDGFMTIPSLLQASILFQISLVYLGMFFLSRKSSERPSPAFWFVQSVLLFYVTLDELVKLHLGGGVSSWMPISGTKYWIGIYSFLIVAIAVFFFRDFKALWYGYRNLVILGISGLVLAIVGAFGAEIFKHIILNPLLAKFFPEREVLTWVIEQVRVAFEEFLEMLGETLILYAVLLFVAKKIEQNYQDFLGK